MYLISQENANYTSFDIVTAVYGSPCILWTSAISKDLFGMLDLGIAISTCAHSWLVVVHPCRSFVCEIGIPQPGRRVQSCPSYLYLVRQTAVILCTSVVIFVQSIMLLFPPSYLMFKTNAEHTANIASEYKLTHRKVCELICRTSRHHDTNLNNKKYSSTKVYWIYSITFSIRYCSTVVWSLLDVLRFLHNNFFNDEGQISYASLP